ncbi:type 4 prepilin-like protein leader peptide-processing enzyme [Sphingomonas mucosissima]|uniref:Prepilin leader peptidase/N-methyltransferase n=2 Tax=Sphingomonas mucosissima TaxID=370959 RepID=A0A245ZT13_9SPHN|nr:type 4 prepilin-like protein leader peptide-processing enzyme [Sphingomonas mucosissima]
MALAGLGAIIGSFLATVAIRWPAGRSSLAGRSLCDGCGEPVSAQDLVPVVSALWLRGTARCCGARIDPLHGRVEIACALVGLLAGIVASGIAGVLIASFGWMLVLVAALDATEMWIPDPLVAALAIAGVMAGLVLQPPLIDRLIGGAVGFGALWLIGFGYLRLRGREGLGGADPKLFGAIGLWLGWQLLPAVLLTAALVGLGLVAWQLATGRTVAGDDALPFGTYLAVAAYPALLLMVHLAP